MYPRSELFVCLARFFSSNVTAVDLHTANTTKLFSQFRALHCHVTCWNIECSYHLYLFGDCEYTSGLADLRNEEYL